MTFKDWETRFLNSLKNVSEQEKQTALDYYKEIFADKIDAGVSEDKAIAEFGSPEDCASKILSENIENQSNTPKTQIKSKKNISTAYILGQIFLALFFTIPLGAVLLAIIVSFGATAISCLAVSISGIPYAIVSPFYHGYYGMSLGGILFNIGGGITATGLGALLTIGFYYVTKYCTIYSFKLLKLLHVGRAK